MTLTSKETATTLVKDAVGKAVQKLVDLGPRLNEDEWKMYVSLMENIITAIESSPVVVPNPMVLDDGSVVVMYNTKKEENNGE